MEEIQSEFGLGQDFVPKKVGEGFGARLCTRVNTRHPYPTKIPDICQNDGYYPSTRYPSFLSRVYTRTHSYPSFGRV